MINLETMKKISREAVKKKLWTFGYKVKDVSKTMPFDLFVNDKYKVDVRYARFYDKKNIYKIDEIGSNYSDVLIIVSICDNRFKFWFRKNSFDGKFDLTVTEKQLMVYKFKNTPSGIFSGPVKKISFIPRKLKLENDEWYSLREASQLLSYTTDFTKLMIMQNKLKYIPSGTGVGIRYKIKGEWIDRFMNKKVFTK